MCVLQLAVIFTIHDHWKPQIIIDYIKAGLTGQLSFKSWHCGINNSIDFT